MTSWFMPKKIKYSKQSKLGGGAFGTVYKGRFANRDVAVKRIDLERDAGKEMFLKELKNPYILENSTITC